MRYSHMYMHDNLQFEDIMTLKEKLKISKDINSLPKDTREKAQDEYMATLEKKWPGIQEEYNQILSGGKAKLGWVARFKRGFVFGRKMSGLHAQILKELHQKYCQ